MNDTFIQATTFLQYIGRFMEEHGYEEYDLVINQDGEITIQLNDEDQVIFNLTHTMEDVKAYILEQSLKDFDSG